MMKVKVKIEGIKPLVFHKFNIESITALSKPKSGNSGNNPEEWKNSFFHDDEKLYIPDNYIFACLKNAAVHTKVGRGSIQKTWISAVNVLTEKAFLNREIFADWENATEADIPTSSSLPVYIDIRMVANPNTKGKNVRYRVACSPGWETEFELLIDDSLISQQHVKKVIEDAGKLQGIAELRTLGYGRFIVNEMTFEKE
ncbi:MAG: hypothetical protein PVF17_00470 [Ignavibacteria bacterium]|jgi:hypothetical protein